MRRLTVILLILSLCLGLVSCGNQATNVTTAAATAAAKSTTTMTASTAAATTATTKAVTTLPHGQKPIVNEKIVKIDETVFANAKYKLAYGNWNDQNSFTILVRDSFEAACKFYGIDLMRLDNKQDAAQAAANVDNAIQAKANYYFQYNQDASVNAKLSQKLADNGIPTITIQNTARIGVDPEYVVDNTLTGTIGGDLLVKTSKERWPNEKPILFVAGHPEVGKNFIDRANGCIDAVKKGLPGTEVFEISTGGSPEITRQKTADFLTAHPKGKILMWCHIDQNSLGMLGAVKAAGRLNDVLIASVGGNNVIFEELKKADSPVIGTVAHFPERWGWDMVPMAIKHLNNGTKPVLKFVPPLDILTRANLKDYYPNA